MSDQEIREGAEEDTEGQVKRKGLDEDDTEGQKVHRPKLDEDDTEGQVLQRPKLDDGDNLAL